jgi:hypothetical protein
LRASGSLWSNTPLDEGWVSVSNGGVISPGFDAEVNAASSEVNDPIGWGRGSDTIRLVGPTMLGILTLDEISSDNIFLKSVLAMSPSTILLPLCGRRGASECLPRRGIVGFKGKGGKPEGVAWVCAEFDCTVCFV